MIERMQIVNWYTPEEKMPPEGKMVVVTISGKCGSTSMDHAVSIATWFDDGEGWMLNEDADEFTVHAWCDLKPYGSGE